MELSEATKLGFSAFEYEIANNMMCYYSYGRVPSISSLMQMLNVDYNSAMRVRYLMELINGRKEVETSDIRDMNDIKAVAKHFRKINASCSRLSMDMLSPTVVKSVPKVAVVRGIRDEKFTEINSRRINDINEYYIVEKQTSNQYVLKTSKRLDIKSSTDKDRIVNIVGRDIKGNTVIAVNNENVRVCNRFIVVASIRQPTYHNGMYVIVTQSGDILYVYAKTLDGNRNIGKNYSERVYRYGIIPCTIVRKLKEVAVNLYRGVGCVCIKYIEPTEDFKLLSKSNNSVNDVLI